MDISKLSKNFTNLIKSNSNLFFRHMTPPFFLSSYLRFSKKAKLPFKLETTQGVYRLRSYQYS